MVTSTTTVSKCPPSSSPYVHVADVSGVGRYPYVGLRHRELGDHKISSSASGWGLLSQKEYTQMMSERSYGEVKEMGEHGVGDKEESWMDDFDASSIDTIYRVYRDKVGQ